MGKVCIVRLPLAVVKSESELKDLHARKSVPDPQGLNLRSYDTEILRDDREIAAELAAQGIEKLLARTLHPLAVLRGLLSFRDLPAGFKSAEMIDPDDIEEIEIAPEAVYPPSESGLYMLIPAIQRIAPELAICAECIWRNTGRSLLLAILVYLQKLTVRPGIGTSLFLSASSIKAETAESVADESFRAASLI